MRTFAGFDGGQAWETEVDPETIGLESPTVIDAFDGILRLMRSLKQVSRALKGGTITSNYVRICGLPLDLEGKSCGTTLAMVDECVKLLVALGYVAVPGSPMGLATYVDGHLQVGDCIYPRTMDKERWHPPTCSTCKASNAQRARRAVCSVCWKAQPVQVTIGVDVPEARYTTYLELIERLLTLSQLVPAEIYEEVGFKQCPSREEAKAAMEAWGRGLEANPAGTKSREDLRRRLSVLHKLRDLLANHQPIPPGYAAAVGMKPRQVNAIIVQKEIGIATKSLGIALPGVVLQPGPVDLPEVKATTVPKQSASIGFSDGSAMRPPAPVAPLPVPSAASVPHLRSVDPPTGPQRATSSAAATGVVRKRFTEEPHAAATPAPTAAVLPCAAVTIEHGSGDSSPDPKRPKLLHLISDMD